MVSAGDFKNGITLEMDGNIWQIIEFQHVKPGKGAAFVRTKLKILRVVVLLKSLSDQQRNSHLLTLISQNISIFTQMEISMYL